MVKCNFGVRPLQLLPKPSEARGTPCSEQVWHGHSIMHCKAPVWVKPNLGEAQLGHQASAEYKLRFCLHLRDVYFGAVYSAGSETERVALKETVETQNRSTIQI